MNAAIALIDESRLFREGMRRICEDWPFQIGFEAASLDDFECDNVAGETSGPPPELILIDTPQDGRALREELARAREKFPDSRLILLTGRMKLDRLAIALAAGVDGYLLKDVSGAALLQSLRLVLQGEKVFPTELAHLLVNGRVVDGDGFTSVDPVAEGLNLSDREREILQCLTNGYSNKRIASVLVLSESKVKGHIKALLRRIQVQNRTQAAIWALNHGVGVDVAALKCSADHESEDEEDGLTDDEDRHADAQASTGDAPTPDDRREVLSR